MVSASLQAERIMSINAPHYMAPHLEMSQKEFWINAYLAALHRLDHDAALKEADGALEACNRRWAGMSYVIEISQHLHNCPIGFKRTV